MAILNQIDANLAQAEQETKTLENNEDPDAETISNRQTVLNGIWSRVHTIANKYSVPAPTFDEQPTAQSVLDESVVLLNWINQVASAQLVG